jgi:acyl-CoA thioesterase FadM
MPLLHTLRVARFSTLALFKPKANVCGERTTIRVWIGLRMLDYFFHVNNAKFVEMTEFGRFDYLVRSGLFGKIVKSRGTVLVAAVHMHYMAPINPFRFVEVDSEMLGMYDKSIIWKHTIRGSGKDANKLYATAIVKGAALTRKGKTMDKAQVEEYFECTVDDVGGEYFTKIFDADNVWRRHAREELKERDAKK